MNFGCKGSNQKWFVVRGCCVSSLDHRIKSWQCQQRRENQRSCSHMPQETLQNTMLSASQPFRVQMPVPPNALMRTGTAVGTTPLNQAMRFNELGCLSRGPLYPTPHHCSNDDARSRGSAWAPLHPNFSTKSFGFGVSVDTVAAGS